MFEQFNVSMEATQDGGTRVSALDEMREARLVSNSVEAVIGMNRNEDLYLRVRANLVQAYQAGGNNEQDCWRSLNNHISQLNRELGTRGQVRIEQLTGQLASTIALGERVNNPDRVIGMRIRHGDTNFGPIGIVLTRIPPQPADR